MSASAGPPVPSEGSVPPAAGPALEGADRIIVGLVESDAAAIARELALEVCAWWQGHGELSTLHGPVPVARALVELLADRRPERLSARGTPAGSVLISALASDAVLWSLELRAEGERVVGCIVRGASRPRVH